MSTRTPNPAAAPFAITVLLLASAVALAACGGGTSSPEAATSARADVSLPAPLFDERGRPLRTPPSAVPADTAARTRPGLYATRAQYERQERMSGATTILLDVDELGTKDMAVVLAQRVRGYRADPDLVYFVRARRLTDAAEVVNTLADDGFEPVFMIVR